jgi:hypothetical protein
LWFLPLALLPILLHLLTLHRLKTVELSTFRFLFDSYVQQRRRMRFLEALLAILRTLFLLFLIAVVARPVVRHWDALFGSGSGRDVVMLVDCSASMNARAGGTSSLERAKTVAQAVAGQLASDDRLTLIRVASKPEELFSRFTSDAEAIEEKIANLKAGPSRGNFFAALGHVFGPQAPTRTSPVVYLFTDCQSSGWREVRDQPLEKVIPADVQVIVVNVGPKEPQSNRAVVGHAPRERRAIAGLPIVLRARVVNYSPTETEEVPVSVFIDQQEVARTTLTLKPGESGVREVVYTPREPGTVQGRFEIPTDRFPDDDDFLFTVAVAPQVRVLLVNGYPAADPFENEGLYLRTALASTMPDEEPAAEDVAAIGAAAGGTPPSAVASLLPKKEFLRSLDVQEVPENQLNAQTLSGAKVVVLANCGALGNDQFGLLRDYVARGGGLLILPGDKVTPAQYNDQFFPVPGPQNQRLTSARLGPPEGELDKTETFERLTSIDFAHPALAVFDDPQARYLATAFFYRRFPLTLDGGAGNGWPLATFGNGSPALVESRFGDGLVQVAAFPGTARWTNLPLKPEFVPLVLRLVGHLEHRPELEAPSVVSADGSAEITVSDEWAPATGKVTAVSGPPEPIEFHRAGSRLAGAFDRTIEKGYYTVTVTSGRSKDALGLASFAVNLAPEESRFEVAGEEQLREWLPGANLSVLDASAQAEQLHGPVGDEREIWGPLIVFMFVVIIVEFLLATLAGAKTDNEEPLTIIDRIRGVNPSRWVGRMTGAGQMTEVN